jgi:uncharacterized protein (TIGR02147 family)
MHHFGAFFLMHRNAPHITPIMKANEEQQTTKKLRNRDFRLFLQNELIRRCEKNPHYSLRAFAKTLGVHHASLSGILAGKRPLTSKTVNKFCLALNLSPTETRGFIELTKKNSRFSTQLSAQESAPVLNHEELTLDTFMSISEWYHDAILELTHIRNFKANPKWIAKALGITASEVNIAAERLQRLELLEISQDGTWVDLSRNNTTNVTNDFTSIALRKYQKKILELSIHALENLPRTQRDHTSTTIAIQSSDLAEAKERIKEFRFELAAFLQRDGVEPDSVFQLALSFFPLTRPEIQGDPS